MDQTLIRELTLDDLEVLILTEGQVVDFVVKVKLVSLGKQCHHDVSVSVCTDVEVAWHTVDLDVAFKLAALVLLQRLLDLVD